MHTEGVQAVDEQADSASGALNELARDAGDYARALCQLVACESGLASLNLTRLLIVALLVPAIGFAAIVAVDALLVALLHALPLGWVEAVAAVAAADCVVLVAAIWLLRSWWRSLSLPRSRAALAALWQQQ